MIYISRSDEPLFWKDYCQNHPGTHYDDLQATEEGRKIRRELREYNIEQQHGLCAYCCKRINAEDSLNEHIKPRGLGAYAGCSMRYSNIVASCKTEGTNATCSAFRKTATRSSLFPPLMRVAKHILTTIRTGKWSQILQAGSIQLMY